MNKSRNNTDRAFREPLRQYQQSPPEEVWNGIAGALDGDRRKTRMVWMGRIAASAALILAVGGVWIFLQRDRDKEIVKSEVPQTVVEEKAAEGTAPGETAPKPKEAARESSKTVGESIGTTPEPGETTQEPDKTLQESGHGETILASLIKDQEITATEAPDEVAVGEEKPDSRGTSMQPLNGKGADHLRTGAMTRQFFLAVHSPYEEVPETDKGIDVFEEFGEDRGYEKWAVGGQVTPLYSYRNLETATDASVPTGLYNDIESGVLSYAGGVNLNYFPAKRLSLQSGIYYSRMGISISNAYLASASEFTNSMEFSQEQLAVANSSGQIEVGGDKSNTVFSALSPERESYADATGNNIDGWSGQEAREGELLQRFEYLEIPMILRYRVVDRKMGLNLMGGFSTNFLVGNNVYFEEAGNREFIGTTGDIKTVNYSSILGLGLQYSLSRNFNINLEPTFRYYLNSINSGSGVGSHPYSIGFFTGISYSF